MPLPLDLALLPVLTNGQQTYSLGVVAGAWTCPYAATFQAVFALVCVLLMIAAVSTLGRPWALPMQPVHLLAVIMNMFVTLEYCRMFEWRILEIGPQAWRLTWAWPYEASPYRDCLTGGLSQEFRMQVCVVSCTPRAAQSRAMLRGDAG